MRRASGGCVSEANRIISRPPMVRTRCAPHVQPMGGGPKPARPRMPARNIYSFSRPWFGHVVTVCPTHGLDAARELGALAYMRGGMQG
eukprot:3001966-Pyramimonas_sp.AAC.1